MPRADGKIVIPKRRLLASTLIVHVEALRWPSVTFDLREYWATNQTADIRVVSFQDELVVDGDEMVIRELQAIYDLPDKEIPMWLISGSESRSTCPRCIYLCQNYPGFYQHCEDSMSKTLKEIELGLIDGPYPGLLFIPQRSDANSVVVKNGKARKVVDGSMKAVDPIMTPAGPIDLSINAGQDLDLDQHIFARPPKGSGYWMPPRGTSGRTTPRA